MTRVYFHLLGVVLLRKSLQAAQQCYPSVHIGKSYRLTNQHAPESGGAGHYIKWRYGSEQFYDSNKKPPLLGSWDGYVTMNSNPRTGFTFNSIETTAIGLTVAVYVDGSHMPEFRCSLQDTAQQCSPSTEAGQSYQLTNPNIPESGVAAQSVRWMYGSTHFYDSNNDPPLLNGWGGIVTMNSEPRTGFTFKRIGKVSHGVTVAVHVDGDQIPDFSCLLNVMDKPVTDPPVTETTVTDTPVTCTSTRILDESADTIHFPDPEDNHLATCWMIAVAEGEVIRLTFTKFELEHDPNCKFDVIKIYDGPSPDPNRQINEDVVHCRDEFTSTGSYMYVTMATEGRERKISFQAEYIAT